MRAKRRRLRRVRAACRQAADRRSSNKPLIYRFSASPTTPVERFGRFLSGDPIMACDTLAERLRGSTRRPAGSAKGAGAKQAGNLAQFARSARRFGARKPVLTFARRDRFGRRRRGGEVAELQHLLDQTTGRAAGDRRAVTRMFNHHDQRHNAAHRLAHTLRTTSDPSLARPSRPCPSCRRRARSPNVRWHKPSRSGHRPRGTAPRTAAIASGVSPAIRVLSESVPAAKRSRSRSMHRPRRASVAA